MSLEDAIKRVQTAIGVTADGKWGPKTEAAFRKALAKAAETGPGELNARSREHIGDCHPDLIRLAEEAIKGFDFTVIEGHRDKAAQDKAFEGGFSKVRWPNSKHNSKPSRAFDACPNPIDFDDVARFKAMRAHFQKTADALGIKVRFISWDLPHVELA